MKRRMLFVCPTFPKNSGNGLSMRAGAWLRALSPRYDVDALVLPLAASSGDEMPQEFANLCTKVNILKPNLGEKIRSLIAHRFSSPGASLKHNNLARSVVRRSLKILSANSYDLLLVHRLYLTEAVLELLLKKAKPPGESSCHAVLDLDDIESITRGRIAALCEKRGMSGLAAEYLEQAEFYRSKEQELLNLYDQLIVCSENDKQVLAGMGVDRPVGVVPNSARAGAVRRHNGGEVFKFLFVGNMWYFPNLDAIDFLADQIVPCLRRCAKRRFEIAVVGSGSRPHERKWRDITELKLLGEVDELTAYYAAADAVVVPIRAGGGTRIKVLEAFANGLPVVSTSCGAEGISAVHEREVLIADDPRQFAFECCRLMEDTVLRASLSTAGKDLFSKNYSESAVDARISEIFAAL